MTKHTQGPWTVETILDQDGDGSSCFPSYGRSREEYILMNPTPTDDDEIEANARLIAAAPLLLAALSAARGNIDDSGMGLEAYGNLINQIDAALDAAEEG